jgi:hypothetical protein
VIEVKLYFPEYQQQKANLNYSKNNDYVRPVIKSGAGWENNIFNAKVEH